MAKDRQATEHEEPSQAAGVRQDPKATKFSIGHGFETSFLGLRLLQALRIVTF